MTFDELEPLQLSFGDLSALGITFDELGDMSAEDLLKVAQGALERYKPESMSRSDQTTLIELKAAVATILLNIVSSAVYDAAKTVDWLSLMRRVINFVTDHLPQ